MTQIIDPDADVDPRIPAPLRSLTSGAKLYPDDPDDRLDPNWRFHCFECDLNAPIGEDVKHDGKRHCPSCDTVIH